MNKLLDTLKNALRFDNVLSDNYELLETEFGEPDNSSDKNRKSYEKPTPEEALFKELDKNLDKLRTAYRTDISKDLVIREFSLCGKIRSAIAFINGMVDSDMINNFILRDGMQGSIPDDVEDVCEYAVNNIFTVNDISMTDKYSDTVKAVLDGLTVVLIDGSEKACTVDTRKYPQRSVEAAENEKDVLGPKEAFIENLRTNITLIRRHVHTNDLVCEMRTCGEDTKTNIGILYRDGVADESLVAEVKKRIAAIKTRSVISTGIINQMIEKNAISPFPQTLMTERPDRCASYIADGHIAVLCDGSPIAAILPVTLFSLLSAPADTYSRQAIGNVMRIVRYIGALISVTLPGIFIAIVMYHQGFLSSEILSTLITSRKMVFIPIGVELLMLLFVFQLVREAGMRVPGTIGQAIGIIGGLVLGQAVVSANLASSVVLILVALTGLGTFGIPDYTTQLCTVYFRVLFILAGWLGGFMGLTCATIIFIAYLTTLKSFGVPFLTPYSPKTYSKRPGMFRGPINSGRTKKEDYMQ